MAELESLWFYLIATSSTPILNKEKCGVKVHEITNNRETVPAYKDGSWVKIANSNTTTSFKIVMLCTHRNSILPTNQYLTFRYKRDSSLYYYENELFVSNSIRSVRNGNSTILVAIKLNVK